MATNREEVIFSVDIQANTARLAELSAELRKAKEEHSKLVAMQKAGTITQEQLDAAGVKYRATLAANSQETRILTNANAAQVAINNAAAGSVDQLAAKAKLLTAQYNALGTEQKKSAAGKALQAELKQTNELLKEAGANVGDFRRSVGNYKEALTDAAKESGLFGGVIDRATTIQGKFAVAQRIASTALGEGATASRVFGTALLAIPLFAVIAALGLVYKFLTSTQEGMDLVSRKTAALGAVLRIVSNVVVDLGAKLLEAAKSPKQAFEDLGDFIETNLTNRVKAFGVILDAIRSRDFKKLADGIIQANTGIADGTNKLKAFSGQLAEAATTAEQLEAANQRILRAERALNVVRDESRAKIEGLKKASDDSTKSVGARAEAAKEASRIENALLAEQLKLQDERIANLQASQRLKKNLTNDDLDQLAALRSERAKTAQESLTLQTELQNKINQLATEGAAIAQKLREDAIKNRIATIEAELVGVKEGSEKELELRDKLLREQANLELANSQKTAADRKLILAKLLNDELKLEDDFDAKRQERARKFLDEQDKANATAANYQKQRLADAAKDQEDAYAQNERLFQRSLDRRALALEKDYLAGNTKKEDYERGLELIEENGLAGRIVLQKAFNKDSTVLEAQLAKRQGAARAAALEKDRQNYEERARVAQQFGEEVGGLLAQVLTDSGKSLQDFAAGVLIIILDSLEKATIAAAAEAIIKNGPKGIAGLIEGALAAAAITAAFQTAKSLLQSSGSAQPFNTGGIVGGVLAPGTPNKDTELTYLTKGEIVLSQGVASMFPELPPVLGHLNSLAGGVNFAPGYTPKASGGAPDGGLIARTVGAGAPATNYAELVKAIQTHGNFYVSPNHMGAAMAAIARKQAILSLGGTYDAKTWAPFRG
jgi:hypothetical protein